MKGWLPKLLPHFLAVIIFLAVAMIYCKPVLQGEVLHQSDVVQWQAMSKSMFDYKATHGHFPLWTNSMFSGMPAYQIALESRNSISPGFLYYVFTLGLPKPISFFFLACICFYFLTQVLRINPYIGIIGGLVYAYATYNPILVATGHETKIQSIAILPALIASIMLIYERRYLWGAALTALFSALLIGMNHLQIVYYTLIIAGFMTIGYAVNWIKQRELKHLAISLVLVVVAGLVGALTNAVNIFTTYEYSKETIRGGSELADKNSHSTKTGLSESYAFDYSMYKTEPFVMMVPKMYGGSDGLEISEDNSKAIEALQQMPQQLAQQLQGFVHFYWGGIGGTSGPPYVGAIICFLALIGFFVLDTKQRWWILACCVLTIIMSWGGYFAGFNSLLLKYLPMYNKFRAPSMIIVVPTFLFCMMAVMTLQKIVSMDNKEELWNRYKKGLLLTGGIFVVLLLMYLSFDYTAKDDNELLKQVSSAPDEVKNYVRTFINALKDDRRSLFFSSLVRSFLFVAVAAFIIWLSLKRRIQGWLMFTLVGILAFIDVMAIDVKYLNSDNYQEETDYQSEFKPTQADQQIMADKSYYRVLDLRQGLQAFNYGAMTAYFHNSIGGYHPAKLSIYQDLIEHQLLNFPNCLPVINMLNTKYIIQTDQSGKESVIVNPDALGPSWFVKAVKFENSPTAVMNDLTNFKPRDTAIVFTQDQKLVSYTQSGDTSGSIQLVKNDNDEITYKSNSPVNRFAVFSEVYYDKGWNAYIDGKEQPIVRTDYVLRGLSVPAGQHEIRFVFHPSSYYTGDKISLIAGIIVLLLLVLAIVQSYRKRTIKTLDA
jgi:hypothetical protein